MKVAFRSITGETREFEGEIINLIVTPGATHLGYATPEGVKLWDGGPEWQLVCCDNGVQDPGCQTREELIIENYELRRFATEMGSVELFETLVNPPAEITPHIMGLPMLQAAGLMIGLYYKLREASQDMRKLIEISTPDEHDGIPDCALNESSSFFLPKDQESQERVSEFLRAVGTDLRFGRETCV